MKELPLRLALVLASSTASAHISTPITFFTLCKHRAKQFVKYKCYVFRKILIFPIRNISSY